MSNPTTHVSDPLFTGWDKIDPVRFDNGLWLEEATINYVANPSIETDTANWGGSAPGVTLSRVADGATYGASALQCATNGASSGQGFFHNSGTAAPSSQNDVWTVSADLRGALGSELVRIGVSQRNSGGGPLANVVSANQSLATSPARKTATVVANNASVALAGLAIFGPNSMTAQTWQSDALQLEKKPYSTSYADSSMGAGYSAVGTTHVRAASSASISPAGILEPGSGSLAFRITPTIETGLEEIWGECGVKGAGADHLRWGRDASKHPFAEWSSNDAAYQRLTATGTISAGQERTIVLGYDGTDISLSVDGGAVQTDTRDAVSDSFGAGDLTLKASVGGVIYDEFATFGRVLTTSEIARLNAASAWSMTTVAARRIHQQFQLRPY